MNELTNNLFSDPWLSVLEISDYLGVSKETIYKWLECNKIPAHKIGKLWKFKASEVDSWVTSGKAENDSANLNSKYFSKESHI